MSAPLAAAVASTARGIYSQVNLYQSGEISQGELVDNSMALAGEAGIVALCSVAGQAIIPIPIIGSVVGAVAGRFVSQILKDTLGKNSQLLVQQLTEQTEVALAKIDAKFQLLVAKFMAELDALGNLIDVAFQPANNRLYVK